MIGYCAFTVDGLPPTLVLNTEHAAESVRHLCNKNGPVVSGVSHPDERRL